MQSGSQGEIIFDDQRQYEGTLSGVFTRANMTKADYYRLMPIWGRLVNHEPGTPPALRVEDAREALGAIVDLSRDPFSVNEHYLTLTSYEGEELSKIKSAKLAAGVLSGLVDARRGFRQVGLLRNDTTTNAEQADG